MAGVRTAIRVEDAAVRAAFERLIALAGDPGAALADIGEIVPSRPTIFAVAASLSRP